MNRNGLFLNVAHLTPSRHLISAYFLPQGHLAVTFMTWQTAPLIAMVTQSERRLKC